MCRLQGKERILTYKRTELELMQLNSWGPFECFSIIEDEWRFYEEFPLGPLKITMDKFLRGLWLIGAMMDEKIILRISIMKKKKK